jgi:hypothetical protein
MPAPRYLSPAEKAEEVSDENLDYLDDLDPSLFAAPQFNRRAVIPRDDALPMTVTPSLSRVATPVPTPELADDTLADEDAADDLSAEALLAEAMVEVLQAPTEKSRATPAAARATARTAAKAAPTLASVQMEIAELFETESAAQTAQRADVSSGASASKSRRGPGRTTQAAAAPGGKAPARSPARKGSSASVAPQAASATTTKATTAAGTRTRVGPPVPSAPPASRGKRKPVTAPA